MKTFNTAGDAKDYSRNNPLETVESKLLSSNGKILRHCFYVNGELHGESKSYISDGQLRHHCFYVNGLEHGEFKWYHKNGQLSSHSFFVDGKRHGEYKAYNRNGQLEYHCFYVNGEWLDVVHLRDGSYKSLCIKHTLFNGNVIDEDILLSS